MKKITTYTLCLFLLLTFVACKKKVAQVNTAYVGSWTAADSDKTYSITIESNSKAVYLKYKGVTTTQIKGTARVRNKTLQIFTKKFKMDQAPREDTANPGHYTMVLDGVTFERF
jgi:ribosomal protein S8